MRFIGIAMIFAGAVLAVIIRLRDKKRRIRCIASLCSALELMLGELKLHLTPIPQLTDWLSGRSAAEAKEFFTKLNTSLASLGDEDFAALWRRASRTSLNLLEETELELFIQLGEVLGRYSLDEQCAAINHCLISLRERGAKAMDEYPAARKLSLGLGASAAALLIIILL